MHLVCRFSAEKEFMRGQPGTGVCSGAEHMRGISYPLTPISLIF
jgi:hypothetical protein